MFPKGDPFGSPQLLLISVLGMSTVEGVCQRLEGKIQRRNQGLENYMDAEDIKETSKGEVKYFYRLILFLCICMKSISPKAVNKLTEMKIGQFLSKMLKEIDPHLNHKNLHFSLMKFFQIINNAEIPGIKDLSIDCDFVINIYKKYSRRTNLINSQCLVVFKNLGKVWSVVWKEFVKKNKDEILKLKKKGDQMIISLTSNVLDWNENIIETPPKPKEKFDISSNSINSKQTSSNFNFHEEEDPVYKMIYPSSENDDIKAKMPDNILPSVEFSFGESKDKEFKIRSKFGTTSPDKMNKQFTLEGNEMNNSFEDDEENEAKQKLRNLLANMKKKGKQENDDNDITSFLNNNDDEFLAPLEEPKRLTFKFLNTAIEDENDDDGLLPPISNRITNEHNDFMQNEIDLDISLGKRMEMYEGNESFDDEIQKKLKIN